MTAPAPCPYLPGQRERKVFTHLRGRDAPSLHEALALAGFRRSQSLVYRPACEACDACQSVRVIVEDFAPSRSQRRILKRNEDLIAAERDATATEEQFALFTRYLNARHADGGMTSMNFGDYAMMVGDTPARSAVTEYRDAQGRLLAAMLSDRMETGVSLVYSFFDPDEAKRSLGVYMVLAQIREAAAQGLPYAYLGYWVSGSAKMDYKADYQPLEVLRPGGWRRLSATAGDS